MVCQYAVVPIYDLRFTIDDLTAVSTHNGRLRETTTIHNRRLRYGRSYPQRPFPPTTAVSMKQLQFTMDA
ncbi:MAG: hypothetical protein H6658_14435 [Ardenticatenaceae bacterium]|nr:hypothetical protein [Ardenticatenaceae bacterium]